jgi:hypothetical protein
MGEWDDMLGRGEYADPGPQAHLDALAVQVKEARAERDRLQARVDELEAQKEVDHETWLQEVELRTEMLIERDARIDKALALVQQFENYAGSDRSEAMSKKADDPDRSYWEGCAEAHRDDAIALRAALAADTPTTATAEGSDQ